MQVAVLCDPQSSFCPYRQTSFLTLTEMIACLPTRRVNETSGRSVYSGMSIHTAKAVADCVCGGLVVLSEAARLQLLQGSSSKALPLNAALLHAGGFVVQEDHMQSRVSVVRGRWVWVSGGGGWHEATTPA